MMPLLAASEKGPGQTESPYENEVEMWWVWTSKLLNQTLLESKTIEGDSPVDKNNMKLLKRVGLPGLEVWI